LRKETAMKPVVIQKRTYTFAGIFLFLLCTGAGMLIPEKSWLSMTGLGVFLGLLFGALGSQKTVFSEAGIERSFLWWHSLESWDQVVQAGITKVADRGDHGAYLLLTLEGGRPKTRTMGFRDWKNANSGKCEYVPASKELRELVKRCYGPLDFDLADGCL